MPSSSPMPSTISVKRGSSCSMQSAHLTPPERWARGELGVADVLLVLGEPRLGVRVDGHEVVGDRVERRRAVVEGPDHRPQVDEELDRQVGEVARDRVVAGERELGNDRVDRPRRGVRACGEVRSLRGQDVVGRLVDGAHLHLDHGHVVPFVSPRLVRHCYPDATGRNQLGAVRQDRAREARRLLRPPARAGRRPAGGVQLGGERRRRPGRGGPHPRAGPGPHVAGRRRRHQRQRGRLLARRPAGPRASPTASGSCASASTTTRASRSPTTSRSSPRSCTSTSSTTT